jgi:hypothetical protein
LFRVLVLILSDGITFVKWNLKPKAGKAILRQHHVAQTKRSRPAPQHPIDEQDIHR